MLLKDEFLGCENVRSLKVHHYLRIQMVSNGDTQHRAISLRLDKSCSTQLNTIHRCPINNTKFKIIIHRTNREH